MAAVTGPRHGGAQAMQDELELCAPASAGACRPCSHSRPPHVQETYTDGILEPGHAARGTWYVASARPDLTCTFHIRETNVNSMCFLSVSCFQFTNI